MTDVVPKLSVDRVHKSYGAARALRETSLEVAAGEFLTLLGPSGSGKTTLLMILAGLGVPDGGEVRIDGRVATYAPVHERDIGMVFQNYALFPHLTVYENIAFPLRMRRVAESEIQRRVQRILDIVRLPHTARRLPRELSGGQQQRIALARCAVYEPSIILMDEPLGALDKKLRDQMQLEIKRLHVELGTTILFVTHDQEEALTMSDRICLMNEGGIEQLGTPDDLYFRPRTAFAADFLGGSNIFDAVLDTPEPGSIVLRGPGGQRIVAAAGKDRLAPGAATAFMVRPEQVRLLSPGETADNRLDATLVRSLMVGAVTRHYLQLDDGDTLVAVALTTGSRRAALVPGARVQAGWAAADTVLLSGKRHVATQEAVQ
ncbi:ABC transporter ATP-binding protein [Achromobacter aloeverae]|uniref:Spermidine/putrescine ABC transporter ATP-binding protein n=1 Tax=Achromobacter aloeverae TaxID=1750518 RepID=A0A4Q1HUN6_9BURK|nr:ABC transporter ATP-binding protein [Achromobacter aloeverae]RXN93385.1 spermidine/putrescine ABC transporter ATP-binding protein [Achromobacter aloeverae]